MLFRRFKQSTSHFLSHIRQYRAWYIALLVVGCVAGYIFTFVIPRHVVYAYAGDTCVRTLQALPALQTATDTSRFRPSFEGGLSIGSLRLFATRICFTPTAAPTETSTTVATAPWGGLVFRTHYVIETGKTPVVRAAATPARLASSKPLTFTISQADTTFTYTLTAGSKSSTCMTTGTTLACPLAPLALAQGTTHDVALTRSFQNTDQATLITRTVDILPAVTINAASLTPAQVVYDTLSTIQLTANKPLTDVSATLSRIDGEARTPITSTAKADDTTIAVTTAAPLEREKQFELTLTSAEGKDGSVLADVYTLAFSTSGGPKVQQVSIGSSNVDPNAQVVVTFDQPIADNVDITKYARISGAPATIRKSGAQVTFALSGADRCAAFTLTIDKGVTSATNGMTSSQSWSHSSRISCKKTVTIGTSVRGRAITAYYYGSGSSTVLFTGGMHGSEPSGYITMQAWTSYLDSHAHELPAGTQVVVVPNTNPDGIATGSRYNANGVNIDRNFPTADWQTDIDTADGHKAGGGGSSASSEPETKALVALTAQLRPRLEVSFHAKGSLVGANQVGNSAALGSTYARTVGYSTMYGNAEELMGYTITGEYETWIGENLGLPAILIELPGYAGSYFSAHRAALWKLVSS